MDDRIMFELVTTDGRTLTGAPERADDACLFFALRPPAAPPLEILPWSEVRSLTVKES